MIAHAFNLDGLGPRFLQDRDPLDGAEDKAVAGLLIDTPGARTLRNNADLFVKRGAVPVLSRGAAAIALYAMSSYAPAGGAGHRTSLRGGGPMTTLIVADHSRLGNSLWGRLWPNVGCGARIEAAHHNDIKRIFPWLVSTRTSNPNAGGRPTTPDDVHRLQLHWGMPRRIRLGFGEAQGRKCGLTGVEDSVVVTSYRHRNYGTNYSDEFEHPLTPYYRQSAMARSKRPVHPPPGGISYRLWPAMVVGSADGFREPAQVVRHWENSRAPSDTRSQCVAFGYVMDNMKARAWVEGEMPLWPLDSEMRPMFPDCIRQMATGAATVARLVIRATKSALYNNSWSGTGDYGFIAERFYRDTQAAFFTALGESAAAIAQSSDSDDPAIDVRRRWASVMETAALRLFDEYAASKGLEQGDMRRHVRARFYLTLALRGRGMVGRTLFESDLAIPSPETATVTNKPAGVGMPYSQEAGGASIAYAWWRSLNPRRLPQTGRQRAALARMRRADAPIDVMQEPEALRLVASIPRDPARVATLAGVLAWVRETDDRRVARAIGHATLDDHRPAVLSQGRFRHLLQADHAELMEPMRRLVRMAKGTLNVRDLSSSILCWGDEVKTRWIFDYYGVVHGIRTEYGTRATAASTPLVR